MLVSKFDEAVHELCLAAGLQRHFQAAQGRELNVQIANFTGPLADSSQDLQEFLLFAAAGRIDFFEENLQTPTGGSEAVNHVGFLRFAKPDEIPLHFPENQLFLIRDDCHKTYAC